MIDIQEILNKHFKDCYEKHNVTIPDKYIPYISLAIKEIITEVLQEAANNAKASIVNREISQSIGMHPHHTRINKKSITAVINKVKF